MRDPGNEVAIIKENNHLRCPSGLNLKSIVVPIIY